MHLYSSLFLKCLSIAPQLEHVLDVFIKVYASVNQHGVLVVGKSKRKEWNERLLKLQNCLKFWINNETSKTIELVHLYYDSF